MRWQFLDVRFYTFSPPLTRCVRSHRVFPSSRWKHGSCPQQTNKSTHTVRPRPAHLRLGATRAPRWRRGGEAGHREEGSRRRSVHVSHGWTSWVWLCVNGKEKKIHAQMDFQGWGGWKGGRNNISLSNVKDSWQRDSWLHSCHSCFSQVPLRWYMVTSVASGRSFRLFSFCSFMSHYFNSFTHFHLFTHFF